MICAMKLVSFLDPVPGFTVRFPTLDSPSATASVLATATAKWREDTVLATANLRASRSLATSIIASLHDADTTLTGVLHASTDLR